MAETLGQRRFGAGRQPAKRADPGRGIVAALNFAAGGHARAVAFLVLCGLLFYLPGFFSIPAVDRDEARFAQATRQMVETGDFVDIRFQEDVRYKKPVGIYWLQAAAVEGAAKLGLPNARLRIWLYRVPSLIGAIGAVLLTYWSALAFVSRRGAVLAALMLCSSLLLGVEAHLAKVDAMLLLTTTAALGAMARVYLAWQRGEEAIHLPWLEPAVFWTALAGGILLKGPLILMVVGLPIVTLAILDRSAGWLARLRPVWGLMWLLVLVLPWFVAILWRSGDAFIQDSIGGDLWSKLVSAQESHGAPPGTYFLLFWVTFWPGASLAALAAPAVWRARREPAAQFLLAWLVPCWIVFELVITKLPHYVLPLYPAIAILTAGALEQNVLSRRPSLVRWLAWWFLLPAILGVLGIVAAIYLTRQPAFAAWPFAAAAAIFGLFAWRLYDDNDADRSLLNASAASFFISAALYGIIAPSLTPLFPSASLAKAIRSVECSGPLVATSGFQEPSLIFNVGTNTAITDPSGAADFLAKGGCRFAFVDTRYERLFGQRADQIGLRYAAITRIDAYNYSQGKPVSIGVFASEGTR